MSDQTSSRTGEVLRLRSFVMIENIRRAEDPKWRDWLERQQVVARLGRVSGGSSTPLEAMLDYADRLQDELPKQNSRDIARLASRAGRTSA